MSATFNLWAKSRTGGGRSVAPGPEHYCPMCGLRFKSMHYLRPEHLFALWCANDHRWTLRDFQSEMAEILEAIRTGDGRSGPQPPHEGP
jgi:hypothetical protein